MNTRSGNASRPARTQSGKAGSVILVILLGTFCGAGWAVIDYKKKGGDLDKLRDRVAKGIDEAIPVRIESQTPAGKSGSPVAPAPRAKTPAPPKTAGGAPKGTDVAKVPAPATDHTPETTAPETPAAEMAGNPAGQKPSGEPVSVQPARPVPPPAAAPANAYGFEEVFTAMRETEADLKVGRFAEARERLVRFEPARVIDRQRKELSALRDRTEMHFNLLRETNLTPAKEPPRLTTIEFRVPKGPFTGTLVSKDDKKVELLLLSNITVTFETFEVLKMEDVDALRSKRLVEGEFERRWKQIGGRKPMDAFRAAEFCLRNGLPDRVAECFDRAIQIANQNAIDLLATVREEKSEALYETFVFFLSIGNIREARSTLDIMRLRYAGSPFITKAEEMERETLSVAKAELSSKVKMAKPIEIASAAKPEAPAPEVKPATPASPVDAASPDPAPKDVKAPPAPPPPSDPPPTPMTNLSADKQEAFKSLVNEANASYDKALDHLKRSDPSTNPDGWLKENKAAMELLSKAYNAYNQALDIHNDASLWGRVSDTNFKRVLCRKRMIK